MMRLIAFIAMLALAGCAVAPTPPVLLPILPAISANVAKTCESLPEFGGNDLTMGDLYVYINDLIGQYADCAVHDRAKLDWIRSVAPAASTE